MNQKSKVPSPCVNVCSIDMDSGFCRGCMRTLDEVTDWPRYSDEQKLAVHAELAKRREATKNSNNSSY